MKLIIEIALSITIIIIGSVLVILPVVQREQGTLWFLQTIGGLLLFFGLVLFVEILVKHGILPKSNDWKSSRSGPRRW